MMRAIITRRVISCAILFLLPVTFLFSQSEDSQKILDAQKEGIITLMGVNDAKQIVGEGTGWVIEPGVVATCYQVISKATSVIAKNFKGKIVKVDGILAVDKNLNIALLRIKGKAPALAFGNSDELESGKKVSVVGSNESGEIVVSNGEVNDVFDLGADKKVVRTSLDIPRYFSGAPLLDENGQVLGVVIFFERRLRITLASNALKNIQKQTLIKFKNWKPEDYLATTEGALFAGKVSAYLDETGRARQYLEKVRQARPDDIEVHSILASVYDSQRDFERAILAYEKVISMDASRDKAYYGMGMVYIKMRRFEKALPYLEKAVELNPIYKDAFYYIGSALQDLKKFESAADAYKKYLESNPENAWEAYYRMAVCYVELENYDEAIAAFQASMKEKPDEVRIGYDLAQVYERSKQYDKAEETYRKISQVMPEDPIRPYRVMLMMYDKAKMPDKAIQIAVEITQMDPNNYEAFYNLGYMYMNTKKYNAAIAAFSKAMELNPGYEYTYSNIGYIYYLQKKYQQSINVYKKLVEIVPDNANSWYFIGVNYMLLKNFDSAVDPLKKAVELQPNNANSLYNLAIAYLNLHDNYSAREIYKKLKTIDPGLAKKLEEHLR
ncbi:MAG: tetratricopeptide repeat protein [Candidatus Aminicenantes bacterium]|nr:tetratricopeptide repeat protein [Candidatus Aminicenantes bacterium]